MGSPIVAAVTYFDRIQEVFDEAGVDSSRVLAELSEHWNDLEATLLESYPTAPERAHQIVLRLGPPEAIARAAVDSLLEVEFMATRSARLWILLGLASALGLLVAHVVPSHVVDGTLLAPAVVIAALGMTVGATMLARATGSRRSGVVGVAFAGVATVVALVFELTRQQPLVHVDNWNYIVPVVVAGVGTTLAARIAGVRASLAAGALVAGASALVLNAALDPVVGIGNGSGNLPVALLVFGWLWLLTVHCRQLVSTLLSRIALRVGPEHSQPEDSMAAQATQS